MAPSGLPPLPGGSQPPLRPARLADFRLAGALGAGTTAKVYDAVDLRTGEAVAVKVLEPSQSGTEARERFAREAIFLAGVASRHVGRIVGFGFEHGQPFLVLEKLQGETLDAKLRRDGPVARPIALRWIEQLLIGVRDCHDQQIIHRDIKPSNIFLHLEGDGEIAKLIDFGVARLREITGDVAGLTSTHHLLGSMGYMAPEQFRDPKAVGFTADLYAVGVVIFRTLTGRLPFVSRSLAAVIKMKAEQAPPAISSMPGMPKSDLLDWFVTKTMSRDPRERFQSAREMLEHWWRIMNGDETDETDEDEETTDVTADVAGVDESDAGPLWLNMREARDPYDSSPEAQEDRTLSRVVSASVASAVGSATSPRPASSAASTATASSPQVAAAASDDRTLHDLAPNTLPSSSLPDSAGETGNPFDVPTQTNANLRDIVQRELELHRRRRGTTR